MSGADPRISPTNQALLLSHVDLTNVPELIASNPHHTSFHYLLAQTKSEKAQASEDLNFRDFSAGIPNSAAPTSTKQRTESSRPSLFLIHSNQAAFTVGTGSSKGYSSGEDTSDVSEDEASESDSDDEPCSDDYLEKAPLLENSSASPRKVASSPDFSHRNRDYRLGVADQQTSRQTLRLDLGSGLEPSQASEFGANGNNGKGNIFYILNSPSPTDKALAENYPAKRQDSLFTNSKDALVSRADLSNSVSSLEVSEDEEVDFEIDHSQEKMQKSTISEISQRSSNIAGSKLLKSVKSMRSTDTESEWISVSSDGDPGEMSPLPPPLSFCKRIPALSSPSSHRTRADHMVNEEKVEYLAPRSLLSGLFLNEMAHSSSKNSNQSVATLSASTSQSNLKSPADKKPILKRSSTTGIITVDRNADKKTMQRPSIILLKRYASLSDISRKIANHRSPVLYVAEEDTVKEGEATAPGGASDENQFAKQVSSVGLSDFMVVANSTSASSVLQSHIDGLDKIKIVYQQPSQSESRLSTSLSKYSTVQPNAGTSFKSFLSKSSLNLTSLFGQPKALSKPRLEKRSGSSETVKSVSTIKSPKLDNSPSSLEDSPLKIDQGSSRGIKILSFPRKDFQPSIDISNSLKDSLLIDHKLGKIPLPERVISEEDLFNGQDFDALMQESDDYHAKGW